MTITITEQIVEVVTQDLNVTSYGPDQLVRLPFAFSDGHLLEVVVARVDGDVYTLSDCGQTAETLWSHGLDLSTGSGRKSWVAVKDHLRLPPAMAIADEYQLAMTSTSAELGRNVIRLGEAMLLAEGLRSLAKAPRGRSLRDRIVRVARDFELGIVPRAGIATRFGANREVTAKVVGKRELYVQGVGGHGDKFGAYDRARSIWTDSLGERDSKLSVIGVDAALESWQRQALDEISTVATETGLQDIFGSLTAA